MSGGSFDYLYRKLDDADYFKLDTMRQLIAMENWLREQGKHEPANELLKLRLECDTQLQRLTTMSHRLEDVMRVAEWWCSGDMGEDQFDETWAKFNGKDATNAARSG